MEDYSEHSGFAANGILCSHDCKQACAWLPRIPCFTASCGKVVLNTILNFLIEIGLESNTDAANTAPEYSGPPRTLRLNNGTVSAS